MAKTRKVAETNQCFARALISAEVFDFEEEEAEKENWDPNGSDSRNAKSQNKLFSYIGFRAYNLQKSCINPHNSVQYICTRIYKLLYACVHVCLSHFNVSSFKPRTE